MLASSGHAGHGGGSGIGGVLIPGGGGSTSMIGMASDGVSSYQVGGGVGEYEKAAMGIIPVSTFH